MSIQLPSSVEETIQRRVESGRYHDAAEVVIEALRLLDERDQIVRLRDALSVAQEQVRQGQVYELTIELLDEIRREADDADRLGLPISDDVKP
jgi:antitoxin ParD1/3/4